MELNAKNIKKILLIILFAAITFTALFNFGAVANWLLHIVYLFKPVIIALCISFVLNVLLVALENKVFAFMDKCKYIFVRKAKRPLCLVLTYLIALGVVTLLISVIIPDLFKTIVYIAEKLPAFMQEAKVWSENLFERFNLSQSIIPNIKIDWNAVGKFIKDYISNYSDKIFGSAFNITSSVVTGLYNMLFSFIISIYVLAQKERIGSFMKRLINALAPKKIADVIHHISSQTYISFSRFIGGQFTEAIILGILCFVGMTVFRFPNAAIISILICLTALVPIVGAMAGTVIGFLLIVITNPIKAVFFVIFLLILQQIEGNFIYPKVVGKFVGLPGVIVICAVLIGGNIGGIMGALVSVPISAVAFTILKEIIAKRTAVNE